MEQSDTPPSDEAQLNNAIAYIVGLIDASQQLDPPLRSEQQGTILSLIQDDPHRDTLMAAVVYALEHPDQEAAGTATEATAAEATHAGAPESPGSHHYNKLPSRTFPQIIRELGRCGVITVYRRHGLLLVNTRNNETTTFSMHTGTLPPRYLETLLNKLKIPSDEYFHER